MTCSAPRLFDLEQQRLASERRMLAAWVAPEAAAEDSIPPNYPRDASPITASAKSVSNIPGVLNGQLDVLIDDRMTRPERYRRAKTWANILRA